MKDLELIETKWIKLADHLDTEANQIAGPFFSLPPPKAMRSILYSGKATRGLWGRTSFRRLRSGTIDERLSERRDQTKEFLTDEEDGATNYNSGFWHFATVETLRLEIELYEPQLICFVTWDYAWELVKEVIRDRSDASWNQSENEQWLWFRPAARGWPAILLTGHPERKSKAVRRRWLQKASELLPT